MSKITKKGKITIIDNELVIKEEENLETLYEYLKSRNFYNFIPLTHYESNRATYQYKKEIRYSNSLKTEELINTIAKLHNSTLHTKEISKDTNKRIYNNTKGYIKYLEKIYYEEIEELEIKEYLKPSEQLYIINYSKLISSLEFIKNEIDKWYRLVEKDTTERVVQTHGNLSLSHFITSDDNYLINWANSKEETPIKDLIILYNNEWNNINFKEVLDNYLNQFNLTESELKLFFIYISLPMPFKKTNNEYIDITNMTNFINHIYKTEELIRPYYLIKQEKE